MEGVSFWEWVAMYGLDGVVGAVLAGAVAWYLLRRTIRHELDSRVEGRYDEARSLLLARVSEVYLDLRELPSSPRANDDTFSRQIPRIITKALVAQNLARGCKDFDTLGVLTELIGELGQIGKQYTGARWQKVLEDADENLLWRLRNLAAVVE